MNAQDLVERVHAAHAERLERRGHEDNAEYRTLATEFLAQHGVRLKKGQMIVAFPHILVDDGERKTLSLVVSNRKYAGTDSVDVYTNATWFEIDPTKPAMDVTHLPEIWEYDAQGRIVEHKPAITYRK